MPLVPGRYAVRLCVMRVGGPLALQAAVCLPQRLCALVLDALQRLREAQSRQHGWIARGVQERVLAVLSRVVHDGPAQSDGRLLIAITHDKLAAHCGLSRPKLSLELKRLEQAGTLQLHRGAIEILDRGAFTQVG